MIAESNSLSDSEKKITHSHFVCHAASFVSNQIVKTSMPPPVAEKPWRRRENGMDTL